MEATQLERLASPTPPQPRAFVYRSAESTTEPQHPLRRRSDVRAVPTRASLSSALLQFRVYLRPE
jgi:hypothetical protein